MHMQITMVTTQVIT